MLIEREFSCVLRERKIASFDYLKIPRCSIALESSEFLQEISNTVRSRSHGTVFKKTMISIFPSNVDSQSGIITHPCAGRRSIECQGRKRGGRLR